MQGQPCGDGSDVFGEDLGVQIEYLRLAVALVVVVVTV
jgi:hypothetical protein